MVSATFRFHAELNDFLPPHQRQREFTADCAREATVKHMIEALGVPHTELGRVVVNDLEAGLGQRLADGDRVVAHPGAGTPTAARPLRFIADAHLGGLARLLRLAGFDTLYDNGIQDNDLVAIAQRDGRIVLSRDIELLKRRDVIHGCYPHALKPELQFREIAHRLDLAASARPFSLCLACNAPLRPVPKVQVLDRLPERVRERHDRFATCDVCGRVFWEGSHWWRMRRVLDEALGPAFDAAGQAAGRCDCHGRGSRA